MLRLVILLVISSRAVISDNHSSPPRLTTPPKPRVTPQMFVDDGRQFAVFTCYSKGRHRDLLSWYQIQGKNTSQLVMKQFPRDTSTTEMSLVLNKTLTTSDKDSLIYCMRRDVGFISMFSDYIYLHFSRDVPNENLYITVQPASQVATFYVNTTQSFECGGSKPVDGRSFNWYIEDVPSSNNFSHAPGEKMGINPNTRNVNLTLDLDESYHLKRIYCVQEYHMNLQSSDGYYYWSYGEKARSNEILLSMVSKDHLTDSDNMNNERPTPATVQTTTSPVTVQTTTIATTSQRATTTPATVQTTTIATASRTSTHESVKNVVIASACVVIVVLILVIIGIFRRFRKQVNPNEMAENIMSRPPMDLPPEVEYEEVYSHGAGLRRPRRQQARGATPSGYSDLEKFPNV